MGQFRKQCFHYDYPRDVVDLVDQMLSERKFLREIAAATGISKSAIHRHKTNCGVKETPARNFDESKGDVWTVQYEGGLPAPNILNLRPKAIHFVVHVDYEKPIVIPPKSQPVPAPVPGEAQTEIPTTEPATVPQ